MQAGGHQRRVMMLSLTRAAVKEIEDHGFRVRGYHDAIDEGPASLVLMTSYKPVCPLGRVTALANRVSL